MNDVGYTCQITAGFRAVELEQVTQPIISDTLAKHLAGRARSTALTDWQQLVKAQGPGKSLRVPARNRIMDDLLVQAIHQIASQSGQQRVQVVNLGCGMVSEAHKQRGTANGNISGSSGCDLVAPCIGIATSAATLVSQFCTLTPGSICRIPNLGGCSCPQLMSTGLMLTNQQCCS